MNPLGEEGYRKDDPQDQVDEREVNYDHVS
jgi:hypothetical protein